MQEKTIQIKLNYKVPKSTEEDKVFREDIVANKKNAVNFFLEDYSKPILEGIGRSLHGSFHGFTGSVMTAMKSDELLESDEYSVSENDINYYVALSGTYYEFVSKRNPYIDGMPEWGVLRKFKAENNARLSSYLCVVFTRYVYGEYTRNDKNKGIKKVPSVGISTVESEDYLFNILVDTLCDEEDDILSDEIMSEIKTAEKLFAQTRNGKEDSIIIDLSIYKNYTSDEIAEKLCGWFSQPLESMSKKAIQTRISQWKIRAVKHLASFILDKNNGKNFPNLWRLVSEHNKQ